MVAAFRGCESMGEIVDKARMIARREWFGDQLRNRLYEHRDCCGAQPPSWYVGESKRAAFDAKPYTGAPVVDLDDASDTMVDRVRDTDPAPAPARTAKQPARDEVRKKLHSIVRRGPVPFEEICDKLDMSPAKARVVVDEAIADGLEILIEHDHVGIESNVYDQRIHDVGVPPVVGETQRVAVISDLHYGSKFCLRAQIAEFVHYAYSIGVRNILGPGDNLDGCYRHGIWELSHHGLDAQAGDMFDNLPQLDGLNYHTVTGNHDETFEDTCGIHAGPFMQNFFAGRGRSDLHYHGRRAAWINVQGALFHLWHPRGSASYAKSYKLQKKIESYSVGLKPQVTLVGHFHQFAQVAERGVHGFLCPTFQGGGGAFGNSLVGGPAIGGLILEWQATEHNTLRSFKSEYRAYFEREQIHQVETAAGWR